MVAWVATGKRAVPQRSDQDNRSRSGTSRPVCHVLLQRRSPGRQVSTVACCWAMGQSRVGAVPSDTSRCVVCEQPETADCGERNGTAGGGFHGQRWLGRNTIWLELKQQFYDGDLPVRRVTLAAAIWKWTDTVENGSIPEGVKPGAAAQQHLSGFHYWDHPQSNLKTESEKHGFQIGGFPIMDWWRQTAAANPEAPEFKVICHSRGRAVISRC